MAQRYTTFIPGYVFNIFEPSIYVRVGTYPYTFILLWPVVKRTYFAQNFSDKSVQYRIEPKGPPCQYFMN